jgi:hypothetical protein
MKTNFLVLSFIVGGLVLFCSGCTSVKANKVGEQISVTMPVVVKPIIETQDTLISGSATIHSLFGIFTWGPSTQAVGIDYALDETVKGGELGNLLSFVGISEIVARNAAAYNATVTADADIILAPRYIITVTDLFIYKKISCEVKGYPGFIKGVKVTD